MKCVGSVLPLVLIAVLPWVFSTHVESGFAIPKAALFLLAVSMMAVNAVFSGWKRCRNAKGGDCGIVAAVGFMVYAAASLFWAEYPLAGVSRISLLACCVVLYLYAGHVYLSGETDRRLIGIMVIVAMSQALLALLQFAGWDPFFSHVTSSFRGSEITQRIIGTVGYQNTLGGYLAMLLPLCLYLAVTASEKKYRCLWVIASVLMLVVVVLVRSRGAWLGMFMGLLVFASLSFSVLKTINWKVVGKYGLILIAAIILVAVMTSRDSDMSVLSRLADVLNGKSESFQQRTLIWKVTTGMIAERPVFGGGLGCFAMSYLDGLRLFLSGEGGSEFARFAVNVKESHNDYLQIMAELGLVGLALWLLFVFVSTAAVVKNLLSVSGTSDDRLRYCAILSSLVAVYVMGVVSFPFQVIGIAPFFWLLAGLGSNVPGTGSEEQERRGSVRVALNGLASGAGVVFAICLLRSDYLFLQGRNSAEMGDSYKSKCCLERAIEVRPWDGRLRYYYGMSLCRDGWLDHGLFQLSESVRSFSDVHQYLNIGNALVKVGSVGDAGDWYERAYRTYLDRRLTTRELASYKLVTGKVDDGVAMLRGLLREDDYDVEAMVLLGRNLISNKKSNEAEKVFRSLYGINAGNVKDVIDSRELRASAVAEALDLYGVAMILKGSPESAVTLLHAAVVADPDYLSAYNNLGACYRLIGNESAAIKAWESVLAIDPANEKALKNLNKSKELSD